MMVGAEDWRIIGCVVVTWRESEQIIELFSVSI